MRKIARPRALFAIAAATMMVLTLGGAAGAAPNPNADPHYPDLPKHNTGGTFYGALTDSLAFAPEAKQYVKINDARVAIDMKIDSLRAEPGQQLHLSYPIRAYAIDSEHDNPQTFGAFPATRVRTVAFGAVPVEATIHIDQLRDPEGLLVPLNIQGEIIAWYRDAGPYAGEYTQTFYHVASDTTLKGQVRVRVSDVAVDGVAVDVGKNCRPVGSAQLDLIGEGYVSQDYIGVQIPPGKYNPALGGLQTGSIDIPAFSGCTTGSDDLGPLLTAMISGELPLQVLVASYTTDCFNDNPAISSLAKCPVPDMPIPKRPEG